MKSNFKFLLQILLIFLPWFLRRRILNYFFDFNIHSSSHIGFSIILARKLVMHSSSKIGNFSICNAIDFLLIEANSSIGSFIYITGYSGHLNNHFNHIKNRKCELLIGKHSALTSRHFLDCTAGIYIGNFSTLAGIRSQLFTHSIDLKNNQQDAASIRIGDFCFIGTNVTVLPSSNLPSYSILCANSLLKDDLKNEFILYGGLPAKKIKRLDKNNFKYFSRKVGFVK